MGVECNSGRYFFGGCGCSANEYIRSALPAALKRDIADNGRKTVPVCPDRSNAAVAAGPHRHPGG